VITDNNYSLILKLERKGGTFTGSYSRDGKTFIKIGTVDLVLSDLQTGLIVCNGSDAGRSPGRFPGMQTPEQDQGDFSAIFDYFRISNSGLK
jgi:hypothetical protein